MKVLEKRVIKLLRRIKADAMGTVFNFTFSKDKIHENGRYYIQCYYKSPCTKTGKVSIWRGRKWYLSQFMTDDEIVKTCWVAVESAVKHEVMEGFKIDGKILFNPHVNFEELLKISHLEIERE